MKLTNLFAFSLVSFGLVACASDNDSSTTSGNQPTKVQARHAFDRASDRIDHAFASVSNNHVTPFSENVETGEPCTLAGSVDLGGTVDYNDTTAESAIDLTASFNSCEENEGIFDGSLHWDSSTSADHVEDNWTGTITIEDASGSYSCTFDLHSVIDSGDAMYSGTICGFDVNADLGL